MSRWRLGRKDDEYPGSEPVSRSTVRKMEREYRSEHPTRTQSFVRHVKQGMNERALDRRILHAKEKEVHRTAFEAGRIERARTRGFEAGRGRRPIQSHPRVVYSQGHGRRRRGRSSSRHRQSVPVRMPSQAPQGEYRLNMWTGRNEWVPYRRR